jgi:hypothetical protein
VRSLRATPFGGMALLFSAGALKRTMGRAPSDSTAATTGAIVDGLRPFSSAA